MIVMLQGANGSNVLINVDNLLTIDSATDKGTFVVGRSVATMVGGLGIMLKGTVEEIYGKLRRPDLKALNGGSLRLPDGNA